jgi:hypothetical protein
MRVIRKRAKATRHGPSVAVECRGSLSNNSAGEFEKAMLVVGPNLSGVGAEATN